MSWAIQTFRKSYNRGAGFPPRHKCQGLHPVNQMKRAAQIIQVLDETIPNPQIPLHHKDPYTLLIAVLLSAQCTDERVNKITPRLFALADTPEKMIRLNAKEIEEIIRPCGLGPRKAKAIWELSKILIEKRKGQVPNTMQGLLALPGVGRKTASVVLSQAFHKPAFPVDTHIFRCAKRWHLSDGKTVEKTEQDLKRIFPRAKWNRLHLQIILYARKYCPAKGHKVENCPICHQIDTKSRSRPACCESSRQKKK